MPVARPEPHDARVIAHVDMDCFYVQVEQRKQPELRGQPTAVVQYNSWKGGGLIAVSYEARKYGVKRSMRGDEAKEVCPNIQLVQVPVARGKADLNLYRNAGSEVICVLGRKGRCERASIDEVYLDLTDAAEAMLLENPPEMLASIDEEALKSHVLGLDEDSNDKRQDVYEWICSSEADHHDKLLACGAIIVAELRMEVLKETQFTCSAGIAHNKMLAKLASAMNKPAQQTVVPSASVMNLLATFPVRKMKHLGGKLGGSLQSDLGINTVGDLWQFSEVKLQELYGTNTGTWLWNIARGINGDEVEGRLLPKSHGSGKSFPGPRALRSMASVQHWLNELCEELYERLQADLVENKRVAQTLTLHVSAYKSNDSESFKKFPSKSCPLRYGVEKIQEDALKLFDGGLREFLGSCILEIKGKQSSVSWGVTGLSVSASKILAIPPGTSTITKFFQTGHCSSTQSRETVDGSKECSVVSRADSKTTSDTTKCEKESISPTNVVSAVIQSPPRATFTITKFFHGGQSSSSRSRGTVNGLKGCSLVSREDGKATSDMTKCEKESPTLTNVASAVNQSLSRAEVAQIINHAWEYKPTEIDHNVIDELPPEFQEEIRDWLRPQKRTNTTKRGPVISDYSSPAKKS